MSIHPKFTGTELGEIKRNLEYNNGSFTSDALTNYLSTNITPTKDTIMKVWGKFNRLDFGFQLMGLTTGSVADYFWGVNSGNTDYRFDFGDGLATGGTTDTEPHLFEINDGKFLIDGEIIFDLSASNFGVTAGTLTIFAQNTAPTFPCDFTMYKTQIIEGDGTNHIWDFNKDNNEQVVYTINGVVQPTPTIQGTVTSDQWSQYGYSRYDQVYPKLVINDTNNEVYDTDSNPIVAPEEQSTTSSDKMVYIKNSDGTLNSASFLTEEVGDDWGILPDVTGNSFDSVLGVRVVGNGSMYGELKDSNGNDTFLYSETEDIIIEFEVETTASSDRRVYSEANESLFNPFYGLGAGQSDSAKFRVFARKADGGIIVNATSTLDVFDGNYHKCVYRDINGIITLEVDEVVESLATYTRPTQAEMGVNNSTIFAVRGTSLSSIFNGSIFSISAKDSNNNYVFNFDSFSEITDTADSNMATVYDSFGNYVVWNNTHSGYIEQSIQVDSIGNDEGYSVAQALGKNKVNSQSLLSNNYIVFSTGAVTPIAGYGATTKILVEPNKSYSISGITVGYTGSSVGWAVYDEDDIYITGWNNMNSQTMPSNAHHVRLSVNDADVNTFQLELGTTPTTYEAWEGIYKNQALTIPYSDGQPINSLLLPNGKYSKTESKGWYDNDGNTERYELQNVGEIGLCIRIVDGVVDNGADSSGQEDYSNWMIASSGVVIDGQQITITADGTTFPFAAVTTDLKDNTEYTLVFDVDEYTLDGTFGFSSLSFWGFSDLFTPILGENRRKYTSANPIINQQVRFFAGNDNTNGTLVKLSNFRIYEGDYVTGNPPLPPSKNPVVGNSIIQKQLTDELRFDTTNFWVDDYTADLPNLNLIPIDGLEADYNDQIFFDLDDDGTIIKIGYFDKALEDNCLQKAVDFFNTAIGFITNDDEIFETSDGGHLHVQVF